MSLYNRNIGEPVQEGLSQSDRGLPIATKKLSHYIGYLERGKNIVVGGRSGSGKNSFVDYIYFLDIFNKWRDAGYAEDGTPIPHPNRPPLKFIYFNMGQTEPLKLQRWMCLYMKLKNNMVMDIPTLLNRVGKMYDLTNDDEVLIEEAQEFFDELEDNLLLVNGPKSPSDIKRIVERHMDTLGKFDEDGNYIPDETGQYTVIIINNTDHLSTESDGYSNMNQSALERKLSEYLLGLASTYKTTNITIKPTRVYSTRSFRESEPSYKDLGDLGTIADVGLVTYNPFDENNNKFHNYPVEDLVIRGKNRFRTVSVVRNKYGTSSVTLGMIFLGECGYFTESPHPIEEQRFDEIIDILNQLP